MTTVFSDWLEKQLEERDWSQSDLSRHSKISTSQITRLLNGQRNPGDETLQAIARAFKIPPEQAFRAAGLLPPAVDMDDDEEKIMHEIKGMSKDDQLEILAFIRMKRNLRKRK